MRLMHVLITSDTLNGNWTYTRELVSGLITRGLRVTLVSFGEIPLPEQTVWMERLHGLEYHPTAFRLDWMEEGQQDFADASDYLCSLVHDTRPDIFHSNHLCYGALPTKIDADGTAAFEHDPACQGAGIDRKISASEHRMQIGAGGAVPPAIADRPLGPAKSVLLVAVVVIGEGMAGAGACFDIGVVERIDIFGSADIDRAVAAAIGRLAILPGLGPFEIGKHLALALTERLAQISRQRIEFMSPAYTET